MQKRSFLRCPLIIYLFISLLWALYRLFFRLSEPVDEFIFKPLIFLFPLVIWIKFVEREKLTTSLGFFRKNLLKSLLIGFGLGMFFAVEGIITSALKNDQFVFNPNNLPILGLILAGLISLTTGFSEEVLNRGFLMNHLWKKWNNAILANVVSCCFFTALHLPLVLFINQKTGPDLLSILLSFFVLGLADGYIFSLTQNIWAPIISHFLWNWSIVLFK